MKETTVCSFSLSMVLSFLFYFQNLQWEPRVAGVLQIYLILVYYNKRPKYYSVPCITVLCYAALPCAVQCSCSALQCSAVQCSAVQCCVVLCCAVLCCAVLCCAVLSCAVLCCAVLCCAVLCCAMSYSHVVVVVTCNVIIWTDMAWRQTTYYSLKWYRQGVDNLLLFSPTRCCQSDVEEHFSHWGCDIGRWSSTGIARKKSEDKLNYVLSWVPRELISSSVESNNEGVSCFFPFPFRPS